MLTIGTDIGGTFTDVVGVLDGQEVFTAKVPSTPSDLTRGVEQGVGRILALAGRPGGMVDRFIHGTTVATNALLEERGAVVGLITTAGFEDALEIGRQKRAREALYRLDPEAQTPTFIVPRRRRLGVRERVGAKGNVIAPLNEDDVREAARVLVEEHGVTALAVCFLFAFLNRDHERRAGEIVAAAYPDLELSLSSEVDPVVREYERLCMTCTDAYIRPVVRGYIAELETSLSDLDIPAKLQVMQSRGAIQGAVNALRSPVTLVASGPAAGVQGAIDAALHCGVTDVISIDIGGTSSDVALVRGGKPMISYSGIVRGFPLRMASIDVNSIGAGGGSIAWIDSGGGLRVGPRSAGAAPGPSCYGRGGTEPTVTDAGLVLNYLNRDYFAGGTFALDAERATEAIGGLGEQLGLSLVETALGVHRVVNANMADQIRLRSVGRGHDPRHFGLVVLGGAGPVHGGQIAEDLFIPQIIVPKTPGVLAAYGLLVSSIEHERLATFPVAAHEVSPATLDARLGELEEQVMAQMREEDVDLAKVVVTPSADMRYVGQSYELPVPLRSAGDPDLLPSAVEAFLEVHERVYGHVSREAPVQFVNLRVTATYGLPSPEPDAAAGADGSRAAVKAERTTYFLGQPEGVDTPIYDRAGLTAGATVNGPAVIEQLDSTTVVYPGWQATVEPRGEILMQRMDW